MPAANRERDCSQLELRAPARGVRGGGGKKQLMASQRNSTQLNSTRTLFRGTSRTREAHHLLLEGLAFCARVALARLVARPSPVVMSWMSQKSASHPARACILIAVERLAFKSDVNLRGLASSPINKQINCRPTARLFPPAKGRTGPRTQARARACVCAYPSNSRPLRSLVQTRSARRRAQYEA